MGEGQMRRNAFAKRVRALEIKSAGVRQGQQPSCRSGKLTGLSTCDLIEELRNQAWRIKERAEAAGDERLALHCLRVVFDTVEFEAKLRGEVDDRPQTNVMNLNFDPAIAVRMAQTYLARHGAGEQEPK
jgi:hypothetical protein